MNKTEDVRLMLNGIQINCISNHVKISSFISVFQIRQRRLENSTVHVVEALSKVHNCIKKKWKNKQQ